MTNREEEPMLDLAGGHIGMSRHLRSALNILAGSGLAPDMEKQLREIAQGNGSLRDLRHSESFLRLSDSVLAQAQEDLRAQTPDEKKRLIDEGNATLASYRQRDPDVPEPPPPAAPVPPPEPSPAPAPPGALPGSTATTGPAAPGNPAPDRRQSWRDVVVTPDEPDEDDLYFQERRQRGCLQ
ncbi:hypothetical protein [Nocardia flavorosea]|uniref:hypothetical protein n=1 Tax=Nocardia flavorosea TaxID=53429 RepID=UPI002453EFD4|nr:hypothetical protein [Nocardia flavorosea]